MNLIGGHTCSAIGRLTQEPRFLTSCKLVPLLAGKWAGARNTGWAEAAVTKGAMLISRLNLPSRCLPAGRRSKQVGQVACRTRARLDVAPAGRGAGDPDSRYHGAIWHRVSRGGVIGPRRIQRLYVGRQAKHPPSLCTGRIGRPWEAATCESPLGTKGRSSRRHRSSLHSFLHAPLPRVNMV